MIKFIPAHEEHLNLFTPRALYAGENHTAIVKGYLKCPVASSHTILHGNEILGMCGLIVTWSGVAESWSVFSESIVKYKEEFTESMINTHKFYDKALELHRMHTYVKADQEVAIKWAGRLGYKKEGLLEGFGANSEDYYIMARTKKNGGIAWQL